MITSCALLGKLRQDVVATARRMSDRGMSPGTSGNVSARTPGGFVITPTSLPYHELDAMDLVEVDAAGRARGRRAPSSEWRLHLALYEATDAQAIVHAHSPAATALACLRRGLPAFHYYVALAGGHDIRCAAYATFGTAELAAAAVAALAGRRACLLANHGMLALGADLRRALLLAEEVENLADQYLRCLAVGEPAILDEAEMHRVRDKLAGATERPR